MKKYFEKGGSLEILNPIFDMIETILFVRPDRTTKGSHIRDNFDLKRLMITVVIAATPAFLFGVYNAGYQHYVSLGNNVFMSATSVDFVFKGLGIVLPMIFVAYAVGGFWEVLFGVIRRHEINEGFLVTGFLLPLILPPTIPLWQVAVATTFGVVIGKEVFGGTGMNIFNPALIARAFLFFAYPAAMSGDGVWTKAIDTYSKATPLSIVSVSGNTSIVDSLGSQGYDLWNMFLGLIPGSIGETSVLAILIGGLFLVFTGIASWKIMFSVFAGGYVMGLIFNVVAPNSAHIMALPAHYHLVMGGFAFGAVFMATDPVSATHTEKGKYIYGFMIGLLAVLVRVVNPAYPEGMMLAILFMNLFSPMIDNVVVWRNAARRLARGTK